MKSPQGWMRRTRGIIILTTLAIGGAVVAGLAYKGDGPRPSVVASGGADYAAMSAEPVQQLTPPRDSVPSLPTTEELEATARALPESDRMLAGDGSRWTPKSRSAFGGVRPMFSVTDDSLVGIYISGLGTVSRDQYEDPLVDLEELAREKWGEDEYNRRLELERSKSSEALVPPDS